MTSLGDSLDGLKVGVGEGGHLEVALDARGGRALGQHRVASAETPGEKHLGQSVSAAVGHLVEGLVGAHLFACGGDLVLRAKRRVGLGQDAVDLAELDEFRVGEEGMNLNLVDSGLDLGETKQLLETGDGPIGDANGASLSAG